MSLPYENATRGGSALEESARRLLQLSQENR